MLITVSMVFSASSCMSDGGSVNIDDVKERFVYLIEESKELNVVFFGKGLPVYRRDSSISDKKMVYFIDELPGYDRVEENSAFFSIDEIKNAAELVFSKGYLSELYETAFDGIVLGDGGAYIRFYDNGEWFYQNANATEFNLSERIYDYSTMSVVEPSNAEYVNVSIDSYSLADPTVRKVYLSFIYENGNWYLDSPTY
jgi:hypothetical protein